MTTVNFAVRRGLRLQSPETGTTREVPRRWWKSRRFAESGQKADCTCLISLTPSLCLTSAHSDCGRVSRYGAANAADNQGNIEANDVCPNVFVDRAVFINPPHALSSAGFVLLGKECVNSFHLLHGGKSNSERILTSPRFQTGRPTIEA